MSMNQAPPYAQTQQSYPPGPPGYQPAPGSPYPGQGVYPTGYPQLVVHAPINLQPIAMVLGAIGWFMFGIGAIILGIGILGITTASGSTTVFNLSNIVDQLGAGPIVSGVGAILIGIAGVFRGRR